MGQFETVARDLSQRTLPKNLVGIIDPDDPETSQAQSMKQRIDYLARGIHISVTRLCYLPGRDQERVRNIRLRVMRNLSKFYEGRLDSVVYNTLGQKGSEIMERVLRELQPELNTILQTRMSDIKRAEELLDFWKKLDVYCHARLRDAQIPEFTEKKYSGIQWATQTLSISRLGMTLVEDREFPEWSSNLNVFLSCAQQMLRSAESTPNTPPQQLPTHEETEHTG